MGTGQLLAIKHRLCVDTDSGCDSAGGRVAAIRRRRLPRRASVAGTVVRRIAWSDDRGVAREDRRPFVLAAVAWLGGWAWRVSGLGDLVRLARPKIDLAVHIADVVALLDAEQLEQAVRVGHSYAGIVITAVADRRLERLDTVVWLDSSPVPDGTAIIAALSPERCARHGTRRSEARRRLAGPSLSARRWPPGCSAAPRAAGGAHDHGPRHTAVRCDVHLVAAPLYLLSALGERGVEEPADPCGVRPGVCGEPVGVAGVGEVPEGGARADALSVDVVDRALVGGVGGD
jgi:pimeloyl-ACP methyl ester carboxylesterase